LDTEKYINYELVKSEKPNLNLKLNLPRTPKISKTIWNDSTESIKDYLSIESDK
jgi:hypothetical protein